MRKYPRKLTRKIVLPFMECRRLERIAHKFGDGGMYSDYVRIMKKAEEFGREVDLIVGTNHDLYWYAWDVCLRLEKFQYWQAIEKQRQNWQAK